MHGFNQQGCPAEPHQHARNSVENPEQPPPAANLEVGVQKVHIKGDEKKAEKLIDAGYQQRLPGRISIEYEQDIGIEPGTQNTDQ